MKRLKKIKLYFHHDIYQEMETKNNKPFFLIHIVRLGGYGIFLACYYSGFIIWKSFSSLVNLTKNNFSKSESFTQTNLKEIFRNNNFVKSIGSFLIVLIIMGLLVQSGNFAIAGLNLKGKVLGSAISGVQDLTEAQSHLQNQESDLAGQKFNEALKNFENSQAQLKSAGFLLNGVLSLTPQKRDAEHLLNAVNSLSQCGLIVSEMLSGLNQLGISAQGISNSKGFSGIVDQLGDISGKVNFAANELSEVSESTIPQEYRLQFVQAKQIINSLNQGMILALDTSKVLSGLFDGQKNVLMIFQNNNELRATGGFAGTYGAFKLKDGVITSSQISSIYDLDGQLNEVIAPPSPVLRANNRWYMRDANWFLDFPLSAKKITQFYEMEGGETPDSVLAMTPEVIVGILNILGPIQMNNYGITLTADNFVEATQIATSVNYNKDLNKPKQLLADFYPLLMQKISELATNKKLSLLEELQKSLVQKQLLLYSRNEEVEKLINNFNWAGKIIDTDRDYLSVVSSNLGGTKTDTQISQIISLQTNIDEDGSIVNTLKITRTNPLPKIQDMANLSYLRVYVPNGSQLESSSGFTPLQTQIKPALNSKIDPALEKIEKTAIEHTQSGTAIFTESDKTVFGNWLDLQGGETRTATIVYKLPIKISSIDHYSLVVQKQPGTQNNRFSTSITTNKKHLIWKTLNLKQENSNTVYLDQPLTSDLFLGIVINN